MIGLMVLCSKLSLSLGIMICTIFVLLTRGGHSPAWGKIHSRFNLKLLKVSELFSQLQQVLVESVPESFLSAVTNSYLFRLVICIAQYKVDTMAAYELYHDESMENGYWHGMLLIPIDKKTTLVDLLAVARTNTGYYDPISIKKVRGRDRVFSCAESWIQIGFGYLRSRTKAQPFVVTQGKPKGKTVTCSLCPEAIGAKFILFRERDNHKKMTGYPDTASKMETTFRFGIKGGLHYLA
jgi:hypothetical protein